MATPDFSNGPAGDADDWQACQHGELVELRRRLSASRRRDSLTSAAHLGAWSLLLVAVGVFLGGMWISRGRDGNPAVKPAGYFLGGIYCTQCVAEMDRYHAHLAGAHLTGQVLPGQSPMPDDLVAKMQAHLELCDDCHDEFERRYPGVLAAAAAIGFVPLIFATRRRRTPAVV